MLHPLYKIFKLSFCDHIAQQYECVKSYFKHSYQHLKTDYTSTGCCTLINMHTQNKISFWKIYILPSRYGRHNFTVQQQWHLKISVETERGNVLRLNIHSNTNRPLTEREYVECVPMSDGMQTLTTEQHSPLGKTTMCWRNATMSQLTKWKCKEQLSYSHKYKNIHTYIITKRLRNPSTPSRIFYILLNSSLFSPNSAFDVLISAVKRLIAINQN